MPISQRQDQAFNVQVEDDQAGTSTSECHFHTVGFNGSAGETKHLYVAGYAASLVMRLLVPIL